MGLFGPYLRTSSAIVVPTQSTGSYAGACPYSNVNACVPGYACGAPSVFMEAGGTTRRLVTAETPLWSPPSMSMSASRSPVPLPTTAPGTYAHFTWPSGHRDVTSMRVRHVWTKLPTASETRGNAVFAATQHWFGAGPGGYMGTQAWREVLPNGTARMTYRAIFSCWGAVCDVAWRSPFL